MTIAPFDPTISAPNLRFSPFFYNKNGTKNASNFLFKFAGNRDPKMITFVYKLNSGLVLLLLRKREFWNIKKIVQFFSEMIIIQKASFIFDKTNLVAKLSILITFRTITF